MQVALTVLFVVLQSAAAWAEIYSWRDESGVRHFTNVREEIPAAYRDSAQVTVSSTWLPKGEGPPAPTVCEQEPERQAQVVVVPGRPRFRKSMVAPTTSPVVLQGGSVNIEGPLAVAVSPPPVGWVGWGTPLVTTAFDRGRSRHLTLRQLAEEQRWLQETWGWSPGLLQVGPFAGGPRPPCVAWRTCPLR